MRICWCLCFIGVILVVSGTAQEDYDARPVADSLCQSPEQFPEPRPLIASFSYEGIRDFNTRSRSAEFGNSSAEVRSNRRIVAKATFPILLRPKTHIYMGMTYLQEQFKFEDIQENEYPLYQRLEDRSLRAAGVRLLYRRKLERNRFIIATLGASINGDRLDFNYLEYANTNFLFLIGKDLNPRTRLAYGVAFSFDLGIPAVYPVFVYEHRMAQRWKVEMRLPKNIQLRYCFSDKAYLAAKVSIAGASYHLEKELLQGYDKLELRRSALRAGLAFDREIYDWLWFRGEAGVTKPINLFISEPGEGRPNSLIDVRINQIPYAHFTLYLVPPRKICEKYF